MVPRDSANPQLRHILSVALTSRHAQVVGIQVRSTEGTGSSCGRERASLRVRLHAHPHADLHWREILRVRARGRAHAAHGQWKTSDYARLVQGFLDVNMNALFGSTTDRWATPCDLFAALDQEFRFDFDPCPLDGDGDGLLPLFSEWRGKRVFCNPPYGPGIRGWLERGLEAELAVFLLPARTDTKWFHEIVLPNADEIRFIKGRLRFGNATNSAPFPSMVVVFRKRTSR